MMEWFIRWLLEALADDRVRAAIAEIVEDAKPAPVHRPITPPGTLKFEGEAVGRPISKNSAPGAI